MLNESIPMTDKMRKVLTVLYLSLKYPQNGCDIMEANGPIANTQPISVPFSPLCCK